MSRFSTLLCFALIAVLAVAVSIQSIKISQLTTAQADAAEEDAAQTQAVALLYAERAADAGAAFHQARLQLAQSHDSTVNSSVVFDSSNFVTQEQLDDALDQIRQEMAQQGGGDLQCISGYALRDMLYRENYYGTAKLMRMGMLSQPGTPWAYESLLGVTDQRIPRLAQEGWALTGTYTDIYRPMNSNQSMYSINAVFCRVQ